MKYPPVETPATLKAEQDGRALLAQLVRDGRTNTEIAKLLRMDDWRLTPHINEIRSELESLGVAIVRPLNLDDRGCVGA